MLLATSVPLHLLHRNRANASEFFVIHTADLWRQLRHLIGQRFFVTASW